MPIRVDAYITGGVASGLLARPEHLRDVLESESTLELERVSWRALGEAAARSIDHLSIPVDDVLIAVADADPVLPVHASWHAIRLEVGPYRIDGELPTLPGFDPGRALTRPSGDYVMLRDVRLAIVGGSSATVVIGQHALVNRYSVERVTADIMLGFFFPGAAMEGLPSESAASSPAGSAG
jgi:hypothetical protein